MTDTEAATMAPAAELAAALAAVQAELPEVKKTRTAKVEKDGRLLYTYDYADLADVSLAILPLLGRHGLAFMAVPGHQPDGKFGLRYYLLHSSGAQVEGFYEIAEQGGMQMVGGRITYARRYCLCAVTGVAAEDDVDARDDGSSGGSRRMQRRQQPAAAAAAEQQPQHTARRRARPETASPAHAASPVAAPVPPSQGAGEALPPLPGEEETPDPTGARQPDTGSPPSTSAPGDTDYDTPGTVTPQQLNRIWATLTGDYQFAHDEKDQARTVCAHIAGHDLASSKDLSHNEGKAVIDTLSHWKAQAEGKGEHPHDYLIAVMVAEEAARDGE